MHYTQTSLRVDHNLLIDKIAGYGVSEEALNSFRSYLSDRYLQVRVNRHNSIEYKVTSEVPVASPMGPLLSNIFINDIADGLNSEYLLHTDNMNI